MVFLLPPILLFSLVKLEWRRFIQIMTGVYWWGDASFVRINSAGSDVHAYPTPMSIVTPAAAICHECLCRNMADRLSLAAGL